MRVKATVLEASEGRALVQPMPGQECPTGCCACSTLASCGPQVEAEAPEPVHEGDVVLVDMPSTGVVWSTLLVFVLPLLALVAGVMVGNLGAASGSARGLVTGLAAFFIVFAIACVANRKLVEPRVPKPRIVQSLPHGAAHECDAR